MRLYPLISTVYMEHCVLLLLKITTKPGSWDGTYSTNMSINALYVNVMQGICAN
jgi:hypothetical protein